MEREGHEGSLQWGEAGETPREESRVARYGSPAPVIEGAK